jgi:hypothetical protein
MDMGYMIGEMGHYIEEIIYKMQEQDMDNYIKMDRKCMRGSGMIQN